MVIFQQQRKRRIVYHVGVLAFLVFPGLLLLWASRGRFGGSPWPAAIAATFYGAAQIREALSNIRAPAQWDYGCFWLYAHVARMHANLYDPRVFAHIALPFSIDADFARSVIDVGFPYPPPAIALFLPLGAFDDVARGLAWWYVAQLVAFGVAILALQRAFFPRSGARGFVLVSALALVLPALGTNTSQAQTNVFLLAPVALAFLFRDRMRGAFWGALAIWVKPYAVVLILADIAAWRTRRVAIALATIAVSLAASLALVGPQTFATYFRSNPSLREPTSAFTELENQSLLATILRLTHAARGPHISLGREPLYLGLAVALLALTTALCARYRAQRDLCFALALLLGLLLYPGTLESYGTVAILPLLVLWSRRKTLAYREAGIAFVAAATILLQGPLHASFVANVLLWLCCARALPMTSDARFESRTIATGA
jgi:hypothetical protein